tara:strand:- start:248 stop:412 length:165 start_codon:yes stop_codon:yes gene_type:complete
LLSPYCDTIFEGFDNVFIGYTSEDPADADGVYFTFEAFSKKISALLLWMKFFGK